MDELNALLAGLPGSELITTEMKVRALTMSRIPDSEGRWPGDDDYVTTYDPYYAALSLVGFLSAQPYVTNANSEGSGVTVSKPDWGALSAYYRSQSVIVAASGNGVLQRVTIPDVPHVRPTDMSGRGFWDGDVDTDLG